MAQNGGFIPQFIVNGFGFNPVIGVFTRRVIFENFSGIQKLFETKNSLYIKLFLLLPIFFETRDIMLSAIILLFVLIVNQLLMKYYHELNPVEKKDDKK